MLSLLAGIAKSCLDKSLLFGVQATGIDIVGPLSVPEIEYHEVPRGDQFAQLAPGYIGLPVRCADRKMVVKEPEFDFSLEIGV